jgi:hypothetical protein
MTLKSPSKHLEVLIKSPTAGVVTAMAEVESENEFYVTLRLLGAKLRVPRNQVYKCEHSAIPWLFHSIAWFIFAIAHTR